MIYSYSRLSLYETCPYRFYIKYILGKSEPVTKPLALGKAVHKAIELKINGETEAEAIAAGLIEADFHPEVTGEEMQQLLSRAPMEVGETEVHFQLPLGSGISLQGYVDWIKKDQFKDWKSNWRPYGPNETWQLMLYAWALMKVRGLKQIRGALYFLRFRREEAYVYSLLEAVKARDWALRLAEEIELKISCLDSFSDMKSFLFPATPGSHCKHCPFVLDCYSY
ncbi:PD-(D/E)XK nuclease family protein [Paenibacillus sonchi]|uniref:PD-(D/E)XK nuclease family protein n=1 Tax=Paenibacillus sonchi TaxID=373687 RepID=A0A974P7N5_9BACL|nr:PD-(D/E)XK nuclease family protein [Paenibacillus sonchi]QQZ58934.1 PD-(D/E)XK nuclease family protein [Paenibacillus sonchi]